MLAKTSRLQRSWRLQSFVAVVFITSFVVQLAKYLPIVRSALELPGFFSLELLQLASEDQRERSSPSEHEIGFGLREVNLCKSSA